MRTRKRGPRWVLAEGRQNASEPIKLPANDVRMKNRRRLMYRMPLAGLTETLGRLEVPGNRASKYATLATDPPKEKPRSRAGLKWRRALQWEAHDPRHRNNPRGGSGSAGSTNPCQKLRKHSLQIGPGTRMTTGDGIFALERRL